MRLLITIMLLFSCQALAKVDDPIIEVEVVVLEIPPAGGIISTSGTDVITISGLSDDVEIVELPKSWEADVQGLILLQGPPTGNEITIKFMTPNPNWEMYVSGFIGMEPLWKTGQLSRNSVGISTKIMNADDVANSPTSKCSRAKQRAQAYTSSSSNNKQIKGERAKASDVLGSWISEPRLGQLGLIQSSYSFQKDGSYSHKLNFMSICDGCNRGIDCDYFWTIFEGKYTVRDGVFTLNSESEKKVILSTGQPKPSITVSSEHPQSHKVIIERKDDFLLIRNSIDAEVAVFKREK